MIPFDSRIPEPGAPPVRARPFRRALALAAGLLLLAGGCTPLVERFNPDASPRHVFSVGFENITQRYIEPVNTAEIAMIGLASLSNVDGALAVSRVDGKVRLDIAGQLVSERPAPHDRDAYGWAWLTANLIADARRASPALRATGNEDIYAAVFSSALKRFDRYSRYTDPEAASRNRAARDGFGGLGVTIEVDDGFTVITKVHPDTPAESAGLRKGDRITHVDDEPIYGLAQRDIVSRLRGPVDAAVRITVERDGLPRALTVSIIRVHIIPPTVIARHWNGLLHIRITGFNQGTVESLKPYLKQAEAEFGARIGGIILDLRGNPGGLLDQSVAVADLFLGEGRIIATRGRHPESNQVFDADRTQLAAAIPLAVLINGKSASAAEILAVALRDQGRAVLLGSSSFGKGTVQTIVRLPNSAELVVTWARLHAPSGQTLDRQGIVPAFCTNGAGAERAHALEALRSAAVFGAPLPADRLSSVPRGPHYTQATHEACPPDALQPDSDLEAARLLLENRLVYWQAVLKHRPNLAER